MSDETMELELDRVFNNGYVTGQAEAYKDAFYRLSELVDNYKKVEELNNLYSMAKAGVNNDR